jgi:hypothetical protein
MIGILAGIVGALFAWAAVRYMEAADRSKAKRDAPDP